MKKFFIPIIPVLLCLFSSNLLAQSKTGQICFLRSTGTTGSVINFRVYIDDSLACKLKNNTYSIHAVPAGKHYVAAQNSGLGSKKKSVPFEIDVKEGKTVYVSVLLGKHVYCEEITEASGSKQIKVLIQNEKCSTEE